MLPYRRYGEKGGRFHGLKSTSYSNTWGKHIIKSHPEMKGNEKPIRETIEEPDFVYKSGIEEKSDVFYRMHSESTYPKLYIKVAVSYDDNEYGKVRSCWFQPIVTGVEVGGLKYVKSKI